MQKGKRPSKETLEDLYKNKCMNLREIGDIYGVSRQRVQQWIDTYNIERIHNQYKNKSKKYPALSKEDLINLIDKGNKITAMSRKTGVTPNVIKYLIEHYCLKERYTQIQERINFIFEDMPDREVIEKLYSSDISVRRILKTLNCSQDTFYKWLKFYGIERRTRHHQATHVGARQKIYKPQEWVDTFTEDYYSMSIEELRKKYKCCYMSIYNWLNKYVIERKNTRKSD